MVPERRDPSTTHKQVRILNSFLLGAFLGFAFCDGVGWLELDSLVITAPLGAIVGGVGVVGWRRVKEKQAEQRETQT